MKCPDATHFVERFKPQLSHRRGIKPGELEKLCSLDFHFKEVKTRFKKLGL